MRVRHRARRHAAGADGAPGVASITAADPPPTPPAVTDAPAPITTGVGRDDRDPLGLVGELLARALDGSDEASLASHAVGALRRITGADSCEVLRVAGDRLHLVAGVGPGDIALDRHERRTGDDRLVTAVESTGVAMLLDDDDAEPVPADDDIVTPVHSFAVPVGGDGADHGVLVVRCIGTRRLVGDAPAVVAIVASALTLSMRRRGAERDAFRRARRDDITGLVNRDVFLRRLDAALDGATPGEIIGVAIVDLDHFGLVNDAMGHAVGDELLRAVGRRLQHALRPGDVLARLGGDEFVALSRQLRRPVEARMAGERLRAVFAEPFEIDGGPVTMRASVGVAVATIADPEDEPDRTGDAAVAGDDIIGVPTAEILVRRADAALGVAKDRGRERVEMFEPAMADRVAVRLRTESELRRALASDELRIFYQPIVDFATGRTTSVEALVRWAHPGRGLMTPAEFLPISESSGLIEEIGLWVLGAVADQVGVWASEGRTLAVAVNVSPRQLLDARLVPTLRRALHDHDLDPTLLSIEVSERALAAGDDQTKATVVATLGAIAEVGIGITVDDFGAGTAALSQLRSLPIAAVKIDRSLVAEMATSGADYAIVSALVSLARTLGKTVIASGVENDQQFALLADLGCDLAQGHLFSPAVQDLRHGVSDPATSPPAGSVPRG